jgi:hypothetical protein
MEYFLGAAAMLLFFIVYELGKRQGKSPKAQPKATEEELHQAKKIRNDFQKLMNYDVEQATDRKKVEL